MAFVKRTATGAIESVAKHPSPDYTEERSDSDPEIVAFLGGIEDQLELARLRGVAIAAMLEQQLEQAAKDPNAPQPVKDYASARGRRA